MEFNESVDSAYISYFHSKKNRSEIRAKRFEKFKKWVESNDFDTLIFKLLNKHGDDYVEKCYNNGHDPCPNNILNFIFDYLHDNVESLNKNIKALECEFPNSVWEFYGYYFQIIWGGDGISRKLFNKDDKRLLLELKDYEPYF